MNCKLLISIFCAAAGWATAAHATNAVVGPANCNEGGFNDALATVDGSGGGTITFDCGNATITFTAYKSIAHATTVDGGNTITLDGGNTSALFQISASANATLRGLTLQHGVFSASHAIEIFGHLTLDHDVVTNNSSTESPVVIEGGGLSVSASSFTLNMLSGTSGTGGAISDLDGTLDVTSSTFTENGAFDGGAIYVDASAGAVHIAGSAFTKNAAGYGGAIENWGSDTEIATATFTTNRASAGDGGAIWSVMGALTIDRSEFRNNVSSTTGGAVSCYGDSLTVTASTIAMNQAGSDGGAIFSQCALSATNVTITNNAAPAGNGGAISQSYAANSTLTFATVDNNSALAGSGLYNDGSAAGVLIVGNSIVSANPNGNCAGVLASSGYNISDDMYCGSAFTGPGDLLNQAVSLISLGNYGGPTETQPPATGNPAIDHVPLAACTPRVDQRGEARPFGSLCDSGAVEFGGPNDEIFENGFDP